MEEDVEVWDQAMDRGKGGSDKAEAEWTVPLRGALEASACVRNADIMNHMSVERPAYKGCVRSAERRWPENKSPYKNKRRTRQCREETERDRRVRGREQGEARGAVEGKSRSGQGGNPDKARE